MSKLFKCKKCHRNIPNKTMFTKNGCVWCDSEYHARLIREKRKSVK